MNRNLLRALFVVVALMTSLAFADGLPADEQAYLDKHIGEVIVIAPKRLTDPAITKSFGAPIYEITVTINTGDGGNQSQKQIAARVGDKLIPVSRPGTDAPCPDLAKMVNPAFTLITDADAKNFQDALDVLFPPFTDESKKAVAFRHTGREWTFIRGTFFDKKLGFVFTTDDKGKITSAKFTLQLPA